MKTVFLCGMVLCYGFAALEIFTGEAANCVYWLFGGAFFTLLFFRDSKKQISRQIALESRLEPETIQNLKDGKWLNGAPGLDMQKREVVWWYDQAAQDYYGGKAGMMYLTSKRLAFRSEEFRFDHPVFLVSMKPTSTGVEVSVNKRKMKFQTASTPLLLEIWEKKKEKE